jgi:hypothetical protein
MAGKANTSTSLGQMRISTAVNLPAISPAVASGGDNTSNRAIKPLTRELDPLVAERDQQRRWATLVVAM